MKMILEQVSNSKRCEVVEITTLEQVLEIAQTETTVFAGVVITSKSLLNAAHNDPDVKWHITIYDDFIE